MQIYSAWRGFCSQVFGRSARQLHTWELVDPADAGVSFELPVLPPSASTQKPPRAITELAASSNKYDIAPFLSLSSLPPTASSWTHEPDQESNQSTGPRISIAPQPQPPQKSVRAAYRRPAVYGPERVVDDARVRAYHQAVIKDMLWAGCIWGFLWTVFVVGVPGRV